MVYATTFFECVCIIEQLRSYV